MDAERWKCVQRLFHEASALSPGEQASFLQKACEGDEALKNSVLAMLREDASGSSVLDTSLADVAQSVLDDGTALPPGVHFGSYRIKRKLGDGGMGIVYLAEHEKVGNEVAIKVLRDAWLSAERRARFSSEQRFLARLDHPFIARIYDADTVDGTPFFVMEYVDGLPLTEYCENLGSSLAERLELFRSACEAVQYAHSHALVHRDLKPSNILVKRDGSVRLLDFGIAKQLENAENAADLTITGLRLMTPAYAAPEQMAGKQVGLFTDIYSLGVVLYELLAGRLPFDVVNRSVKEVEAMVTEGEAVKPSLAARSGGRLRDANRAAWADLDVLVLSAMHKDPRRRYRSVDALIRDIDHFRRNEPLEARPDSLRYRVEKFVRRRRRALVAASAAIATIAALLVFFTVRLATARNEALAETARTQRIERFMLRLFEGGDETAGPAEDLRIVTLLDRGLREARSLDGDPPVQAELLQTLGTIYGYLGKFDLADSLLKTALEKREAIFGGDSREVVESLVALALLRLEQSQNAEAEALLRRGVAARVPPDDPVVGKATSALGRALIQEGRYETSISVLQDAIRLQSRSDSDSVELGLTITDLANAHFYLGHYAESHTLNLRGLELDRRNLGDRHANVADDLINLGAIEHERGRYAEAERFHREALDITEGWFGKAHFKTASNLTLLARALVSQSRYQEATNLLNRALEIGKAVYGEVHPAVASALGDLGHAARGSGNLDEGESCYRRQLEIERAIHPDGKHERIGVALVNLAIVATERGQFDKAEGLVREALGIYGAALPADHVRAAAARIALGRAVLRQKRYAEAVTDLRAGYETYSKKSDPTVTWLQTARPLLVEAYEALGQSDNAAKFREEIARYGAQDGGRE